MVHSSSLPRMRTQVFRSTVVVLGAIVLKDRPVGGGGQRGDVIPCRDSSKEWEEVISPSLRR